MQQRRRHTRTPDIHGVRSRGDRGDTLGIGRDRDPQHLRYGYRLHRIRRRRCPQGQQDFCDTRQRADPRGYRHNPLARPYLRRPHVRGQRRGYNQMRRGGGVHSRLPNIQLVFRKAGPGGKDARQRCGYHARNGQRYAVRTRPCQRGGGAIIHPSKPAW